MHTEAVAPEVPEIPNLEEWPWPNQPSEGGTEEGSGTPENTPIPPQENTPTTETPSTENPEGENGFFIPQS